MVADIELSEQPIEAEFLQIILGDLDKLRFDLDLFRSGNVRLLDEGVDQLKIFFRVAHDQAAALRQKIRARAGREWHALVFQKFERGLAIDQLLTAGGFLSVLAGSRPLPDSRGRPIEWI